MRVIIVTLIAWASITSALAQGDLSGATGITSSTSSNGGQQVFEGTVTLVDSNRHLVVVQEGERARALKLDILPTGLRQGARVQITGRSEIYIDAFPDYPDKPTGSDVLTRFQTPSGLGDHYVTRLRGFLRPPADGSYSFWITADDEAELWLSSGRDSAHARKIAGVSAATKPEEWGRDPGQQSPAVVLKAGETYYIEAVQREWRGQDHLAVAWQGPGFARCIIEGEYLSPWRAAGDATSGILRESWTNCFITRLAVLTTRPQDAAVIKVREAQVITLSQGDLSMPRPLRIDGARPKDRNFLWAEVEGMVGFVANANGELTLELTDHNARPTDAAMRMTVRVFDWGDRSIAPLSHRRVRIQGVCEQSLDSAGVPAAGALLVQDARQLTLLDVSDKDWRDLELVPMFNLTPDNLNLAWGRRILVRGTVTSQDPKSGAYQIQGDDAFYGYVSDDGTNWTQVGVPVPVAMDHSLAGLAVSAVPNDPAVTATFDQIRGITERSRSAGIGTPPNSGQVEFLNGSVTIQPGGGNGWLASDECHFVYQALQGEGEITARVNGFQTARISDKAGVMMRESLDPNAPMVALVVTHETRVDLQYRQTLDAISKRVDRTGVHLPIWLKLVRRQNTLTAQLMANETLSSNKQVELAGTLIWQNGLPMLTNAYACPIRNGAGKTLSAAGSSVVRDVLIADLPEETAESKQSVGDRFRIRGVATFMDRVMNRNLFFVQDDSGAALVRMSGQFFNSQHFEPGQLLEAEGDRRFSPDAPLFGLSTATLLGQGQLPQPLPCPERSMARKAEAHWVEAEGIVRSVKNGMLLVMEKDGLLPVWVGGLASSKTLDQYVDALVTLRGVFSMQVAPEPMLLVPSQKFIQVREAPPGDPFVIPSFTIKKINVEELNPQFLHRTKVTGAVTYREGNLLFVQDVTDGACVSAIASEDVGVGDHVQVVGFPERSGETVTLREAILRKAAVGAVPEPLTMPLSNILASSLGSLLVRLEGVVVDQKIRNGRQLLELQSSQRMFEAVLPTNSGHLSELQPGSRVQVTGVNELQFASHSHAEAGGHGRPIAATMEVLLRSPADVVLLQRPPWWNRKHTLTLITMLALILIGSFAWIRTLRRRVEQRTRELRDTMSQLRKETEVSATLAERDRLAAEIHDSLEQGLSGVMMQLDGVDSRLNQDAEGARYYLEMARRMVRFSRAEVRHTLWNLESSLLENGGLGAALTEVARQMNVGDSVPTTVRITGTPRPLPAAIEHHLLRCSQEALNNALKHSGAGTIQIHLDYRQDSLQLSVADDGHGFVPQSVLTDAGKHLGLRNLRSRARKMKGQLEIVSQPGSGTTIQLNVPINGSMDKHGKVVEPT